MARTSMRNVLSPADPSQQQGSLAGTMAPAKAASATPEQGLFNSATATQSSDDQSKADDASASSNQPLSEEDWYQLLHNLGGALSKAHPDMEKVLRQMSPDIDYEGQASGLKQKIESRKTEQPSSFAESMFARAGSPDSQKAAALKDQRVRDQEKQKQDDLQQLQEDITNQHIGDLQRRGKFQEALASILLQKGITEAGARTRASERMEEEKLRGENALQRVNARARAVADNFHFDDKLRLKLLDISGKIAQDKLQKYGALDPVTGGFSIKPDQYENWQDETMAEIYNQANNLKTKGVTPTPPPAAGASAPQTSRGKLSDPLGMRPPAQPKKKG